MLYSSKITF